MAFGVTLFALLSFLLQVGFALTGAAALWGLYFLRKTGGDGDARNEIFADVAGKMTLPLSGGVAMAVVGWVGLLLYETASGIVQRLATIVPGNAAHTGMERLVHEGITITPELTLEAKRHALQVLNPLFILFVAVFVAGVAYRALDQDGFQDRLAWFYGAELVLASVLISFPVWEGALNTAQLFFIGHSVHSIMTVGTVLILDFVLLVTRYSEAHEVKLYPVLPDISKVIWLGLAIEFTSVALVFSEAIAFTPKILFMQTVIAVLILNGVFLSGPMTDRLIGSIRGGRVTEMSRNWEIASGLSGSISMVSWLTVTFVDLLPTIPAYTTTLAVYIAFIGVAFAGYEFMEHYKVGARI